MLWAHEARRATDIRRHCGTPPGSSGASFSPWHPPCATTNTTATSSSTCAPLNQHITKEDSLALGLEELVLFEGELGVAGLEGVHLGGESRHVPAA